MPRIKDAFSGIAVYIYESLDAAREGERFGASGFIVTVPLPGSSRWLAAYVVTNKHVIKSPHRTRSRTPVIRLNREDGTVECVPTTQDQWVCHEQGDDVAVFRLDMEWGNIRVTGIPIDQFVTPQVIVDEDIGIGDDTVMVGRFINHEGKQRNTPSVRFGNIAMMDGERIESQELGIAQESLIVETRSLPGYSGSAVLIYSPCATNDMSERRLGRVKTMPKLGDVSPENTFAIKQFTSPKGPYLLGIDWCHIHRKATVLNRDGKQIQEGWYVEENAGMSGVVPAWKIAEVLNYEEFVMSREKEAEELRKRTDDVTLDAVERSQTQMTPEGAEIPIPTQEQFIGDLRRATCKIQTD